MYLAKAFKIKAADGISISATLFKEVENQHPHLIIVGPATAAPQPYYRKFAEYLAQYKDFDVLTFDYRGVGRSLIGPVSQTQYAMSDWGALDLEAVINWADKRYDKIFMVGHSVAGQIFPIAKNAKRISAAYFVGSQSAYQGHWSGFNRLQILIFWHILIPFCTLIFDHLPGWTFGGQIGLSKQAAREWRTWGLHPQGILKDNALVVQKFGAIKGHLHFVAIEDDRKLAPSEAVHALMHTYSNAITSYQFIRPSDLGVKRIGHFGFFKRSNRQKLWSMPAMFFTQFVRRFGE